MFAARRSVAPVRQLLNRQQPRRFDSHAAHHHAAPVNEGFGRSFYVSVGSFALGYVLYQVHKSYTESGSESLLSKFLAKIQPSQQIFEERNAIHTALVEKAAYDRHLFMAAAGPSPVIELRQPELFNSGSPYNVPAGSRADMSAVVAHYENKNREQEESRVARMKDGKVVTVYD